MKCEILEEIVTSEGLNFKLKSSLAMFFYVCKSQTIKHNLFLSLTLAENISRYYFAKITNTNC